MLMEELAKRLNSVPFVSMSRERSNNKQQGENHQHDRKMQYGNVQQSLRSTLKLYNQAVLLRKMKDEWEEEGYNIEEW